MAPSNLVPAFVPLHTKSRYSIGLGTAAIAELVQHAGRARFTHLGLTDLENVYAQVQFHATCRAAGLKPITGVELRSGFALRRSFGKRAGRLVLLAADARGYASLCRIVTRRRTQPESGAPFSASAAPFVENAASEGGGAFWLSDDVLVLSELVRVFGPSSVRALLVRPTPFTPEPELVATARRLGVALVADVDATLLDARDATLQRLTCATHLDMGVQTAEAALGADACRPLPAPQTLAALFADVPEAVREARVVAEACTFDLLQPPSLRRHDADERQRELEQRCRQHLGALAAAEPTRAAEREARLATELRVIEQLGLAELFTSVAALVAAARERGIPIAARGSAVSSLAGHLLGFSPIDPLLHGLYFERFVSVSRRSPPDIDLDVASRRRGELIEWLIAARGPERTARLSSLVAFRPRSAHRAALRALGAPLRVIERWLGRFPPDELAGAAPLPSPRSLPEPWRSSLALIDGLDGLPRQLTLHPGGVALSAAPLAERVPVERLRAGMTVTQYDSSSLARLGCVKVDLLGSHVLDEISDTLAAVRGRRHAPEWARAADPAASNVSHAIPLDDAATLASIDRAETVGCFQLESPAVRAVLARLPVRNIGDVTHALAIVRPGPASGHAKELFLARARGDLSAEAALEPELDRLFGAALRATHGVLLYEEDILLVLSRLGDLPLDTAEALRARLLERADDAAWLERVRRRFLERTGARGISPGCAQQAWADVLRFLRYSFNRAHTVSQALLGYQTAFLKTHAPLELGLALLNHHGGLYPRRVIAAELVRRGVLLLPPSLASSEQACSIARSAEGEGLRIGLGLVRRLRAATRERILRARAGAALASAADLLERVRPERRELCALVESGATDDLLELGSEDYPWVHEAVLERLERGDPSGIETAIARARERLPRDPPELVERYRRLRRVQRELEHLGMHVSDHPLRILRSEADRQRCVPSHRLHEHSGRRVTFAGIIAATRRVPLPSSAADPGGASALSSDGGSVAVTQFITLEDEHGLVEGRLSAAAYRRLHGLVTTPGPYLVEGSVREQQGAIHLAIERLLPFHQRRGQSQL